MQGHCDVLVVGGGINGVGIARDLAGRGWRVALVERDDLAAHTSSASTKLIHGGLRYLEHLEFSLVRKALQEREVLLRSAPHIMWPLRFVMPYDARMRPAWMIRLGLFLYDHLARREVLPGSQGVDLRGSPLGEPLQARYTRGFVYSDGWVDDARLVVLNAVDARERGAQVATHTACIAARRGARSWTVTLRGRDGASSQLEARALVNAAGPWCESFLREVVQPGDAPPLATKSLRLVKGSHIVVPRLFPHAHAYIFQSPDKRIVFAIPYQDEFTLIGTTDVEFAGEPRQVSIGDDEVRYLCEQVSRYFRQAVAPADVRWSYAGVRPLLDDGADASAVTRDYRLEPQADGAPLLTVWGGKITTYRKLAEEAADVVGRLLGERRAPWTAGALLPGGDLSAFIGAPTRPDADFEKFLATLRRRYTQLAPPLVHRLARAYGSRIERVLDDGLGREVAPGLHEGELRYLRDQEWACAADDVLWRRTKLGLRLDADARRRVADWLHESVPAEAACS